MYGFCISYFNDKIILSHGINTWSLWAQDYILENLAKQLDCEIILESGSKMIPNPDGIDNFLSWLRSICLAADSDKISKFYLYQIRRIPPELRNLESNYIME